MSHCFAQHAWYTHAASFSTSTSTTSTSTTTTTTTSSSPEFLECWESDCDFTLAMANTLVVRDVSSVLCWANDIEYTVKGGWVSRLFVTSSVHVYLWSNPQTCVFFFLNFVQCSLSNSRVQGDWDFLCLNAVEYSFKRSARKRSFLHLEPGNIK